MNHPHTLFIISNPDDDVRLYNYEYDTLTESPEFNVVLVLKKQDLKFSEINCKLEELKLKYLDSDICIDDSFHVICETPIGILKELAERNKISSLQVQTSSPENGYISFWFEGVTSTVNDVNCLFKTLSKNNWKYAHPGTQCISNPDLFFLNDDSYLEYQRISDCRYPYTYAPFIPLIAPVYHNKVWNIVEKLLHNYNYESENAFTKFWIPEALSRTDELIHPVVLKDFIVEYTEQAKSNKDIDFKKAKQECYSIIPSLYLLNNTINVQCISLPDSQSDNRKKQFQEHADKFDLEFEFWAAVDGRALTRAEYPSCIAHRGRRVDWHEPLKPGEVGTVLSHKQIIQDAWDDGLEALLVFEDDAILIKSIDTIQIPEDADYLMLNSRSRHNQNGECVIGSCGSESYIVTRRGMYKTLQILEHIDMPIDLILLAHTNSVIKEKASLSTVRNRLNPTINMYHNIVYTFNGDQGMSTFER